MRTPDAMQKLQKQKLSYKTKHCVMVSRAKMETVWGSVRHGLKSGQPGLAQARELEAQPRPRPVQMEVMKAQARPGPSNVNICSSVKAIYNENVPVGLCSNVEKNGSHVKFHKSGKATTCSDTMHLFNLGPGPAQAR